MSELRKYGVALAAGYYIEIPIVKAGSNDFAIGSDWTPAAGDVKVSKNGGTQANITTLPTYTNGSWRFILSATEMQARTIAVRIVDAATKAIEDQAFNIITFGNASALIPIDLSDIVRMGLTALPNAAADAAGGLPISDAGGLDLDAIKAKTDQMNFTSNNIHSHQKARDDLGLKTTEKADVNAECDQSLIDYDSGGGVAKENSVLGIQNNTRFVCSVATVMLIPDSGDDPYRLQVEFYDTDGNMEDPDSNDFGLVLNDGHGTNLNSLLYKDGGLTLALDNSGFSSHKKLQRSGVGRYFCYIKIASTQTPEQFMYNFQCNENTKNLFYSRSNTVAEENPGSTTLADNAVNKDIIAESMKERDVSGTSPVSGSIYKDTNDNIDANETKIDAVKAKTDNLPVDPASETNVDATETKVDQIVAKLPSGTISDFNESTDPVELLATGGSAGKNAEELVDDMWDEPLTGLTHNVATSSGKRLRELADADVIISGTVQSPYTASTLKLEAGANANNNFYKDAFVVITEGTGAGQARHIHTYDGPNRICNIKDNWIITPDATSKYEVKTFSLVHSHELDELGTQAKADVNTECDQALIDYDGPTHAEMTAEHDILEAEHLAINNNIDASEVKIDAVKAKTDNLPADPASDTNVNANETKIDAVKVDTAAIKVQTDKMNFTGNDIHSIPKAKDAAVGLSTQEKTDVLTEARKPIFTDTNPEIVDMSDVPKNPTVGQATMLHYMDRRNGAGGEDDLNQILNDNGDVILEEDISSTETTVTASKLRNPV